MAFSVAGELWSAVSPLLCSWLCGAVSVSVFGARHGTVEAQLHQQSTGSGGYLHRTNRTGLTVKRWRYRHTETTKKKKTISVDFGVIPIPYSTLFPPLLFVLYASLHTGKDNTCGLTARSVTD